MRVITGSSLNAVKRLAEFAANGAGWLSRRMGRGGGTTMPGVVMLKLRPNAIAEYAADLEHGSVLISATNGKTTTARLLTSAAKAGGYQLVTNAEGSNLERGVAAALVKGAAVADLGLFEVDEAALGTVAAASEPTVVVLMNLFRDQLDRYGELETLVDKWQVLLDDLAATDEPPVLVLNADDPNVAALGAGRANVVWFGLDDTSHALAERAHAADATTCRSCNSALDVSAVFMGHIGHWTCPNCEADRPTPNVQATRVDFDGDGQTVTMQSATAGVVTVRSPLPGLHNSYNLVAAFAAAEALAVRTGRTFDPDAVANALGATTAAFGRGEVVTIGDKQLRMLLAKNPTGVNQNVRTALRENDALHVLVLLNDRTADGQDVSWIWDVDWEPLMGNLGSLTLSGDRAWDLALRFRYGGFDMDQITVEPSIEQALDSALAATPAGATVQALPTYTAMLDLRSVLTERGYTAAYWNEDQ